MNDNEASTWCGLRPRGSQCWAQVGWWNLGASSEKWIPPEFRVKVRGGHRARLLDSQVPLTWEEGQAAQLPSNSQVLLVLGPPVLPVFLIRARTCRAQPT